MALLPSTQDKRGVLLVNYDSTYDSAYPTGNKPQAGSTPDQLVSFDGLADAASVTGLVSYWGSMGTTYGTSASTTTAPTGNTSSAKLSIQAGSDGLSETATNGEFGFGVNATDPAVTGLTQGDDIYTGIWIHVPSGFDWRTNTVSTKFLRHQFEDSLGNIRTSKLELQVYHTGGGGPQVGWRIFNEAFPQADSNDARGSSIKMDPGTWHFLTWYVHLHSDGNLAINRLSVDGEFAYERNGTTLKYRDASGVIQTETVLALPTLQTSTDEWRGTMVFTYWNGGNTTHSGSFPTQDQSLYVGSFGYALVPSATTDDQGNAILDGSAFL